MENKKAVPTRIYPVGVTASQTKGKVVAAIRLMNTPHHGNINLGTYKVEDILIAEQAYKIARKMIGENREVTLDAIKNAVSDYRVSVGYPPFFRRTDAYNLSVEKGHKKKNKKAKPKKSKKRENFTHIIYKF